MNLRNILIFIISFPLLGLLLFFAKEVQQHCEESLSSICNNMKSMEFVFNRYQTFLTGIIALIIGALSIIAIRNQIQDQQKGRSQQKRAAAEAYAAAINNYLAKIDRAYREANIFNRLNEDGVSTTGLHNVFISINKDVWNHIPEKYPDIVDDWYFFAEVPPENVPRMIEIVDHMLSIKRCIETLERHDDGMHWTVPSAQWQAFLISFKEYQDEIKARLKPNS